MIFSFDRSRFFFASAVALTALLLYGQTVTFGRIPIDDGHLVFNNPLVTEHTAASIWGMFTSYDPELYVPLTLLTYKVEYLLFGDSYSVYHITNILLFTLNACLVFFLLSLLLRKMRWGLQGAFVATLLFVVHPINTEVAVWISSRKDLLSTFFALLSLLAYYHFLLCAKKSWLYGSIAFFFLGLLSKVNIFVLPVLLLLIDYFEHGPRGWSMLKDKLIFFVLAFVFLVIGIHGKLLLTEVISYPEAFLLISKTVTQYIRHFLVPVNLSLIYPFTGEVSIYRFDMFLSVLVLFFLLTIALAAKKHFPILFFGLFFAAFGLLPSFASFSRMQPDYLYLGSDRYVYVASIGLFVMIGAGYAWCRERCDTTVRSIGLFSLSALILLFYAGNTVSYLPHWRTEETFVSHMLSQHPDDPLVLYIFAQEHLKNERFSDAIPVLNAAIRQRPDFRQAHYAVAHAYFLTGKTQQARKSLTVILDAKPDDDDALALLKRVMQRLSEEEGE